MRILYLSPYVGYPVRSGGNNRVLRLIRCLSRFAAVDVLAIGDPAEATLPEARALLAAHGATLEVFPAVGAGLEEARRDSVDRLPDAAAYFRSPRLARALAARLDARPDVVHFAELVMAQYAGITNAPRVIDRQKVEWLYHEAMARGAGRDARWHRLEGARFRRFEEMLAGRFESVLAVGESDARVLEPLHGRDRLHVVPLTVDERIRRPAVRTTEIRHALLYGALDYPPNVEANAWYFQHVWPILRSRTDLATQVVGSGTPPRSLPRHDPRVVLRGYVPDIGSILSGPGALVVPLRVGGGARTKILEALAAGMPVVSTRIGVENLGLVPGRDYLEAETPEAMAEALLRLRKDAGLVDSLSRTGAAHVDAAFREEALLGELKPLYESLVGVRASPAPRLNRPRVLLIGPRVEAEGSSFPGQRAGQFARALRGLDCDVECVPETPPPQEAHDAFRPDVVVASGGHGPMRAALELKTGCPLWLDLAADAVGADPDSTDSATPLVARLGTLLRALERGDRFSVASSEQRHAVLGQLALCGRLSGNGEDPVEIVPLADAAPNLALQAWVTWPTRWRPSVLRESEFARLSAERFALVSELEALRGTLLFRALLGARRAVRRWLRRSG